MLNRANPESQNSNGQNLTATSIMNAVNNLSQQAMPILAIVVFAPLELGKKTCTFLASEFTNFWRETSGIMSNHLKTDRESKKIIRPRL